MGWMYCVLALHGEYKEARDMRFLSGKKNRELKRASGGEELAQRVCGLKKGGS